MSRMDQSQPQVLWPLALVSSILSIVLLTLYAVLSLFTVQSVANAASPAPSIRKLTASTNHPITQWRGAPALRSPNPSLAAFTLTLEPFATGFIEPVEIAHAGDSRLFVVERKGYIYIVQPDGVKLTPPFLDITTRVGSGESEQGLLGLAFAPGDSSTFYVNYTNKNGDTIIARYKVDANNANLADFDSEQEVLFVAQPFSNHNAGDLAFGADGNLYIPLGDGGDGGDPQGNGQDLSRLLGKMLRINVTGVATYTIPPGNPYANDTAPNTRAEIWDAGLRNPWRFSFDRVTQDIYLGDVGQGTREEIDFQPANSAGAENYGWDCREGTLPFNPSQQSPLCTTNGAYVEPIFDYGRSLGTTVTGGYVYRGGHYPNMVGHYIFADFSFGRFWSLVRDNQDHWVATDHGQLGINPSSFGEDAAGELYVAGYDNGIIYRVQDGSAPPPVLDKILYLPVIRKK